MGALADAGKRLPMVDTVIYSLEKEDVPYWNKFLQGYYDASGVSSDSFDQAIRMNAEGEPDLTDDMRQRGILLSTAARPSLNYMGFNMLDPVVGGQGGAALVDGGQVTRITTGGMAPTNMDPRDSALCFM